MSELAPRAAHHDARPGGVTAACVVTWVFAGIALAVNGYVLLSLVAARDEFVSQLESDDQLQGLGLQGETLVDSLLGFAGLCVVMSVAGLLAATAAYRRSRAGRGFLIAMAALTGVLCIPLSIGVVGLPWLVASIVVGWLMATRRTTEWYVGRPPAQA